MDNISLKVENIVTKGEIARYEQFLLMSLCFQKAVCCRGVRKRLYIDMRERVNTLILEHNGFILVFQHLFL